MEPLFIALIITAVLILNGIGFYLFSIVFASYCIYTSTLKRPNKEQWSRSAPIENENQIKMDEIGSCWNKQNESYKKNVHIVNGGLNLYGEYFDFDSDKCVMILSGRTESLRYGYYFAIPYKESGFNVLVIDARAHGESDGVYNTVGFEESRDALKWVEFLEKEYGIKTVIFHGICIGASTGMLAITSEDCPECVKGIVTEGMFINFGESMRNHLIERKRLWFPVLQCIDFWMKLFTHHSMTKGPIDKIGKLKKPLLMLQSKEDKYSTPHNAQKLYDTCNAQEKEIVWFDKGAHSMLRITDTAKYDNSIKTYISKYFV